MSKSRNIDRPAASSDQEPIYRVARVVVALRAQVAAGAAARSTSFSDEAHRLLAKSLGLPATRPQKAWRKRWRPRVQSVSDHRGAVHLSVAVAPLLVEAARKNGWPLNDEVNSRIETVLEQESELNNRVIFADQPSAA